MVPVVWKIAASVTLCGGRPRLRRACSMRAGILSSKAVTFLARSSAVPGACGSSAIPIRRDGTYRLGSFSQLRRFSALRTEVSSRPISKRRSISCSGDKSSVAIARIFSSNCRCIAISCRKASAETSGSSPGSSLARSASTYCRISDSSATDAVDSFASTAGFSSAGWHPTTPISRLTTNTLKMRMTLPIDSSLVQECIVITTTRLNKSDRSADHGAIAAAKKAGTLHRQ